MDVVALQLERVADVDLRRRGDLGGGEERLRLVRQ
jgi:hypothetical protein